MNNNWIRSINAAEKLWGLLQGKLQSTSWFFAIQTLRCFLEFKYLSSEKLKFFHMKETTQSNEIIKENIFIFKKFLVPVYYELLNIEYLHGL